MLKTWRKKLWIGGRRDVSIVSHGPATRSDLTLERLSFRECLNIFATGFSSLCRDLGTLVKRNKNQLCDYNRGSPVGWDASIVMPGSRVEIFQVIMLPGQPVEWTKGQTEQRETNASNLYNKKAAPDRPGSSNTGIKVISAELASPPGSGNQALNVSCILTQFARESFRFCCFRGS